MPRIDELEHDTHEDGPSSPAPQSSPGPSSPVQSADPAPTLAEQREAMRHEAGKRDDERPWLHEDNPAIWAGDVQDLHDDDV